MLLVMSFKGEFEIEDIEKIEREVSYNSLESMLSDSD